MFEIEQKFHLNDVPEVVALLESKGMRLIANEQHSDTYFNHPCRDFAETKEALRVRRIDGVPHLTYKGPKLPGEVKARRELEWALGPGDCHGAKTEELLGMLGFRRVATVNKSRRVYSPSDGQWEGMTIVIDEVEALGWFVEVEWIASDATKVEAGQTRVMQLANQLGLQQPEPRSYLRMLLDRCG